MKAQSDKKPSNEELIEKGIKTAVSETERLTRGKYGNVRCEFAGIKFDSKKERARFLELKGLADAGRITDLRLQHHFTLSEAFTTPDGAKINRVEYVADFTYTDESGSFVVEDVKSEATRKNAVYSLKKRLMADAGYMIREV